MNPNRKLWNEQQQALQRAIVAALPPPELRQKVEPARLRQIRAEGAVRESAGEVLDYWGKRTIAGLLLMPPTWHNFLHLKEALRMKQARI
jgi:hypothetical protein